MLAGIAASDAICATRIGQIHRGDDHRAAVPGGKDLAATFRRLIDVKDEAHYGLMLVPTARARNAVRWATRLVERAQAEVER